jgi:hypothetical protein
MALIVGVGVGVGVAEGVGVGVGVAVGVAEGVGLGAAVATPLFQTNFFPLFTHVNFLPPAVIVCPAFLHALPALGTVAACADVAKSTIERMIGSARMGFRIPRP